MIADANGYRKQKDARSFFFFSFCSQRGEFILLCVQVHAYEGFQSRCRESSFNNDVLSAVLLGG